MADIDSIKKLERERERELKRVPDKMIKASRTKIPLLSSNLNRIRDRAGSIFGKVYNFSPIKNTRSGGVEFTGRLIKRK